MNSLVPFSYQLPLHLKNENESPSYLPFSRLNSYTSFKIFDLLWSAFKSWETGKENLSKSKSLWQLWEVLSMRDCNVNIAWEASWAAETVCLEWNVASQTFSDLYLLYFLLSPLHFFCREVASLTVFFSFKVEERGMARDRFPGEKLFCSMMSVMWCCVNGLIHCLVAFPLFEI